MAKQLETIEQLYQGEGYRRGQSTFPGAAALIDPWVSKIRPMVEDYKIHVQQPSEVAVSNVGRQEETEHLIYSRVLLEAILKDEFQIQHEGTRHKKVFGLLYALDINNPVCKTYSGYEYDACLNLQIFNPSAIITKQFTDPDFDSVYSAPERFIQKIDEEKEEFTRAFTFLHSTSYSGSELDELLGKLARKCITSTGLMTAYGNMVKMTQSKASPQGIKNLYYRDDKNYTPWTVYQALTATLTNKPDFGLRPDRVLKAYQMFSEDQINFN